MIFPRTSEEKGLFENAPLIEGLIHDELVEYAMILRECPGKKHKRRHYEWFKAREQVVIAACQKWTNLATVVSSKSLDEATLLNLVSSAKPAEEELEESMQMLSIRDQPRSTRESKRTREILWDIALTDLKALSSVIMRLRSMEGFS